MSDSTIVGLPLATTIADDDVIPFTDISDTAEEPTGKTKKITRENLIASGNSYGELVGKVISGGAIDLTDSQHFVALTGEGGVADTLASITKTGGGNLDAGFVVLLTGQAGLDHTITLVNIGNFKLQRDFDIVTEIDSIPLIHRGNGVWQEMTGRMSDPYVATGGAIKIEDTFTCTNNSEQCIHGHRSIVGNYIYFGTESFRTSIAKFWKVNLDDFSDTSSITFPVDANHVGVSDVQYSKNNDKLYVAFRNSGYIAEVDPYTFSGYTDVITNSTCLAGTAIWIEGDYLYQIAQTNPTKLYKYNLTNYSLSASNLTITPANGHGLITNGDYLYAVTGAFAQAVTVWKFNKSDLSQVTSKTYSDMQGGSHDIVAVNDKYLFFGLHGCLVNVGINGFVRIDIDDFNSYDHTTIPSDLVGPVIGCTYHNDYIWLTQLGKPGALLRVDPDSLSTEIYRFPCSYPDYLGDYYYANGPVVFDDKGRAYSSFMPDFWEEELNVPAYLSRYTLSDFYRPYDTQDIIVKKDIDPYISVINTANLVTTHDVTVDVDNGASKGTITASAGTPYSGMYAGQVFELSETPDNNEVYTIDSVTDTVITTTAVISGSDYSGNCAVRARQSNRVFMQAMDEKVVIGGYNSACPENAKMEFYVGDASRAYIAGTTQSGFFLTSPAAVDYARLYLQSDEITRIAFLANNAESLIYYHDDNTLRFKSWPGEVVKAALDPSGNLHVTGNITAGGTCCGGGGGGDVLGPAAHAANYVPQWNATPDSKTLVEGFTITAAGKALIDDADVAAQRSTLGLGSAATRAAEDTMTDGGNLPDGHAVKVYVDDKHVYTNKPAFSAVITNDLLNRTGDGTIFDIIGAGCWTEIFDQASNFVNGTFTAPVTGRYQFSGAFDIGGVEAAHTTMNLSLVTSNRTYVCAYGNPHEMQVGGLLCLSFSFLVDMDTSDTAYLRMQISGGTNVCDVKDQFTFFQGVLSC